MPSTRAYLISWVVWLAGFIPKRLTERQILRILQYVWRRQISGEVVPKALQAANDIVVDGEVFQGEGPGKQTWTVFHCSAPSASLLRDKVVIYWHGGGFMAAGGSVQWSAIRRIVRDYGLPVVYPQYSCAPIGTADSWSENVLQFMLAIASHPRYKGKTIIHMGDSAGGWMALRFQQLIRGVVLGEEKVGRSMKEEVKELVDVTGPSILISPVVNLEVTKELEAANRLDIGLSVELFKAVQRIWVLGAPAAPDIDFGLPADHVVLAPDIKALSREQIFADPRYSLNNGLNLFTRYHDIYTDTRPLQLLTIIGTHDLCYVGCADMRRRLGRISNDVVRAEFIEEPGLFHTYPLLPMPETDRAWRKIAEVLTE